MKNSVFFIYLLILAGSTYLIRVIPFIAIKEKISNSFVRSFLYYIPYAVLTAMTIPADVTVVIEMSTACHQDSPYDTAIIPKVNETDRYPSAIGIPAVSPRL